MVGTPDRDPVLGPGTMVGDRYRIVGFLGEGGMGRVYEAETVVPGGSGPRVALKILRRERGQGDQLARFKQEGKAANRAGHPAIVQVLDFAELPDGTVYLAMERLHGHSLEDWLEGQGRLSDGLRWLAELARGLHAAHLAGVVHRDIKPANLFLHVDPRDPQARVWPKILDFGIAKVVTADVTRIETQAGTLLGTPYYLAPERALGRSLDARADLYSLGVILYEMLTGLVPFDDDNFMGILAQHIKAQPLDPRQAAPDRGLPPGVCQLAMRLLAKEPQQRPAHGSALAEEIEGLLLHEAAAIEAVTTGPRMMAAAGEDTVQLQDLAQRPTAAPADGSVVRPISSPVVPARSTPVRWPLWLAGALGVVLLGGAVSWVALDRGSAVTEGMAPPTEHAPVPDDPEPAEDGAGPSGAVVEPSAHPEPAPSASPEPSAPVEPAPTAEPTPPEPETPDPAPNPASTPALGSDDRTAKTSRPRRPRPKPEPPAPPELKDDVYD